MNLSIALQRVIAALMVACVLVAASPRPEGPQAAEPQVESRQGGPHDAPTAQRLRARLALLSPESPEAYFNLAEDFLDADRSAEGQRVATRLFVLAYSLDLERGGGSSLAASACLALSELSSSRGERDWLRTLAVQVDPRRETPGWVRRKPPTTSEATDYQVAAAVGLSRTGDGVYARQLLRKPEVRARLDQLDRVAIRTGVSGGAEGVVREASSWPCPSCQNHRVERRVVSLVGEARLCTQCQGRPGTPLSKFEYVAQLRFESWLLAGARRTWSSQVTLDMGAPLPDLDPASMPRLFLIDVTRPYFRNDKWVHTPEGDRPVPSRNEQPGEKTTSPPPSGG